MITLKIFVIKNDPNGSNLVKSQMEKVDDIFMNRVYSKGRAMGAQEIKFN